MSIVVKSLEETFPQVHITNGVDSISKVLASWDLTVSMCPVMFNTFHVPLIHNDNHFFTLTLIYILEQIFITFVHKYLLHSWEEYVCTLDVPVNEV